MVGVHSFLLVLLLLAGQDHHAARLAAGGRLGDGRRGHHPRQKPGARQQTHLVTEGLAPAAAGGAHPPGRPGARAPPLLGGQVSVHLILGARAVAVVGVAVRAALAGLRPAVKPPLRGLNGVDALLEVRLQLDTGHGQAWLRQARAVHAWAVGR